MNVCIFARGNIARYAPSTPDIATEAPTAARMAWRIVAGSTAHVEVLLLDMRWDLHTKKCIIKIQRMELGTVGAAIRVKF